MGTSCGDQGHHALLRQAEEACKLMCREVAETLATSTTESVELGWLGAVTTSAMRSAPVLMQCTRCMRVCLASRAAEHQRLCEMQSAQNAGGQARRAAGVAASAATAAPRSVAPGVRKPPPVPPPVRLKPAGTELPQTKLNKVTYDIQPGVSAVDDLLAGYGAALSFSTRKPRTLKSRRRRRHAIDVQWMYEKVEDTDGPEGGPGSSAPGSDMRGVPPPQTGSHPRPTPGPGSLTAKGAKRPAPSQTPSGSPATRATKTIKAQHDTPGGTPQSADGRKGKAVQGMGVAKSPACVGHAVKPVLGGQAKAGSSPAAKPAPPTGVPSPTTKAAAATVAASHQAPAAAGHNNGSQEQSAQHQTSFADAQRQQLAAELMQRLHSQQNVSHQQQQQQTVQQEQQQQVQPAMPGMPGMQMLPMSSMMPSMMMPVSGVIPVSPGVPGLMPAPRSSASMVPNGMIPTNVGSLMPTPGMSFGASTPGSMAGITALGAAMPMQPMHTPVQPALPAGWAPWQPTMPAYGMMPTPMPQGMVPTLTAAAPVYPPNPWGARQPSTSGQPHQHQHQHQPEKAKRLVSLNQLVNTPGP